jgi:hypothetical protein
MHTKFQANPNRFGHSNMTKITASSDFQYRTDLSNGAILHQMWIKLGINLFEYSHKTYIHSIHLLKIILWIYPTPINPNLITKHLSIQTSYSKQHCIFIQFNQLICTQMKWSTRDIPCLSRDHPIASFNSINLQAIK